MQRNATAAIVNAWRVIAACSYHFVIAVWRAKEAQLCSVKRSWETIAENLSQAGFSWGCSSELDSTGRVLYTAEAFSKGGSRRFIVLADDRLSAFMELERVTRRLVLKSSGDGTG